VDGLRLFEIGRRYLRAGNDGSGAVSDERITLGLVLAGEKRARGWQDGKAASFDAYDAKAEALALLAEAGAPSENLLVSGDAGPQFHPGQSGTLRLGPKLVLARFGMLHPQTARQFDLDGPIALAELYLDAIPAKRGVSGFARKPYAPPPLQPVRRDFAFLVPVGLSAADLIRAIRGADKTNIVAARIFDDFRGPGVAEGHKSLAVEVVLQPVERSYAEADLKAIAEKVSAAATKLGATLRG
jgi:phenylalanyl-tRNA synthetase beta chain